MPTNRLHVLQQVIEDICVALTELRELLIKNMMLEGGINEGVLKGIGGSK